MKTAIAEIVADINRKRKTGLLSVMVRDNNSLFKIYFRDGEIYHLSCGSLKGAECLRGIDQLEFSDCSFISEVKLDKGTGSVPSMEEILQRLANSAKTAVYKHPEGGGQASKTPPTDNFAHIRNGLKVALMRQIGPVGDRVLSKIMDSKWRASSPPTSEEYRELINLLKEEIDDVSDRNTFEQEARHIIS